MHHSREIAIGQEPVTAAETADPLSVLLKQDIYITREESIVLRRGGVPPLQEKTGRVTAFPERKKVVNSELHKVGKDPRPCRPQQ